MTTERYVPRIVVVDDDPQLVELLYECLTDAGYRVEVCLQGDRAFEFIRATLPDLVVLDVRMEGMDGFGVLYLLSTDRRTKSIPVLLCTAMSPGEMLPWADVLDEKGIPICYKPFSIDQFEAQIRALLADCLARRRETDQHARVRPAQLPQPPASR